MNINLAGGKILVKIYNRKFTKSTHHYLLGKENPDIVLSNHKIIISDLNAEKLLILKQVHGEIVADANESWELGSEPEADALFSSKKGYVLAIQTADCVPVLISSNDGKIIGAAHCGWRSAIGGILANLINNIRKYSDAGFEAVIGPSIQKESYEVDYNFYKNFLDKSGENKKFFEAKDDGKFLFDLPEFVKNDLRKNDIKIAKHFDDDTFKNPKIYPSYRYATKNNLGSYKGSILSTITII